jgi:PhoD-like phosphatase
VIAQQVMMGQLDHDRGRPADLLARRVGRIPVARQRIIDHLAEARIRNPMIITGDWHSTFVNDIKADFSKPNSATVATEFVGTSISSNGDGIIYGPYYGPMVPANPHIKFFDGDRRGYVRCRVDRELWRTDLRMVRTVSRSDAPVKTFASFAVDGRAAGSPGLAGIHRGGSGLRRQRVEASADGALGAVEDGRIVHELELLLFPALDSTRISPSSPPAATTRCGTPSPQRTSRGSWTASSGRCARPARTS